MIITTTLAIVIGVWMTVGLLYRMPILLHIALWLAPLPYALLLIIALPLMRYSAMIGLAWELLAIGFLFMGHLLPRYRLAMQAPFFVAGYGLLGLGLTLTMSNEIALLSGLAVVILVCFVTSTIVFSGGHPVWEAAVIWLIPPEKRPYAYKHIRCLFVFLTAWLLVIWLYLMMGYAALPVARQGLILVLMSTLWVVLGRLLPRLPGMVGWPVYAAGWFMWFTGLTQVFFSPPEAIVTAVFGGLLSGEALYRSKGIHWVPVFILQLLFSVLQIAWLASLPGDGLLLTVTMILCLVGMWYDRKLHNQAGRITALTSAPLFLGIWLLHITPLSTLGMGVLACAAMIIYSRWEFLLPVYAVIALLVMLFQIQPGGLSLLLAGELQFLAGSIMVIVLRPRRRRSIREVLFDDPDWASPLLWCGSLCASIGMRLVLTDSTSSTPVIVSLLTLVIVTALPTIWLHIPRLPYVSIMVLWAIIFRVSLDITRLPFENIGNALAVFGSGIALAAIACQVFNLTAVRHPRPFPGKRWLVWWLRPLRETAHIWAVLSFLIMLVTHLYSTSVLWMIINCLLLGVYYALVYLKVRRFIWLSLALFMVWLVWLHILDIFTLNGIQWAVIPFGFLLLGFSRRIDQKSGERLELSGIMLLLGSCAIDAIKNGLVSVGAVGAVLLLIGLAVYGYWAIRRIPFYSALVVSLIGLSGLLVWLNPWLLPLLLGMALLGHAVLIEVRREQIENWLVVWGRRWQN
jgi:hypothetical protein